MTRKRLKVPAVFVLVGGSLGDTEVVIETSCQKEHLKRLISFFHTEI